MFQFNTRFFVGLLAVSFPLNTIAGSCKNVVDIACDLAEFSTLCSAIKTAKLENALSSGHWTVFAPTNTAFSELGSLLNTVLADTNLLKDVLLFHAVDEVVGSDDLVCSATVEMANGQSSRTVCDGGKIYQKGGSNPRNDMPRITKTNIETCQGFIHVVDEVLLPGRLAVTTPPPPPKECKSIAETACSLPDFSTLCSAVKKAGLESTLSGGHWTVFAPTNKAFEELGSTLNTVLADNDLLSSILLFHVVDKVLYAEDLVCTHLLRMASGENSRTVCIGSNIYQKGGDNPRNDMPKITSADIGACNGVIHVVDEVMLP